MRTILLVDDDDDIRSLLNLLLSDAGYSVTACESGSAALRERAARAYDAALVDLQMPELDGLATIKALRAMPGRMPIPAMSGGGFDVLLTARSHGADATIAKPFRIEQLLDTVGAVLGRYPEQAGIL